MYTWVIARRVSSEPARNKGIETALAASHWEPAEAMPTLEAEAKSATIIKQEHSFAILPKQRERGEKSLFLESSLKACCFCPPSLFS